MNKTIDIELYNNIYYTTISIANTEIVNFTTINSSSIKKIIEILNNHFDFSYKLEFTGLKEVKKYFNLIY